MFEFRHQIEFQNKDVFNLYGEDFFKNNSEFWESHQSRLNELYKKVVKCEFPIKIIDKQTELTLIISELNKFKEWLNNNQPFSDNLKVINDRNEIIYTELKEKCEKENTIEFEYCFEILGVLWYFDSIEINKKFQIFTLKDVSELDLMELEKMKKIELIKVFSEEEMTGEFNRKRYKINSR